MKSFPLLWMAFLIYSLLVKGKSQNFYPEASGPNSILSIARGFNHGETIMDYDQTPYHRG
ncbi:hypothetical protein [Flavobacterium aquidurense]|uniref:hypothetical protein n=1 Tax=Flavobacterium aquidurense TaxID=362413 RepID=UPI002865569A|nr:hypothetical protein [Flavobacterium aquidurense]MDR7369499.1 hypothetical protein [Flavobacterium aquidurense]